MARAAVKAKQQAKAKAKAQPVKPVRRTRGRRRHASGGNPNQALFFSRLRRQAKFMYVLLAVLFAATFAFLGVGSGSSGLSDLFSGLSLFGGGNSSISKAQKEISTNPAKGYRDLATAYEQRGDTVQAITALQSYTAIRKKDANAWAELGGLQLSQAQTFATQYQAAAASQAAAAPSQPFLPTGTFGTAIGTNPIEQAAAQAASGVTSSFYQSAVAAYQSALTSYKTVAKLRPNDANAQFQVATAAQDAGDYPTAVAALKRYLKLNPQTTQRSQIEQLIKQLSPAPAKPAKPATTKPKSSK
jgi:tetratricopeptide (TPR) repeat protein